MRLVRLTGAALMLATGLLTGSPTAVLGAPGDRLIVTGGVVNVRTRPSTDARIWVQVEEGEVAVEIERRGEWVQVELPARGSEGWIHDSLLISAPGAASTDGTTASTAPPATGRPAAGAGVPFDDGTRFDDGWVD